MSSFKPYFSKSIDGLTSEAYYYAELSSALGATQMATVLNNMEWNYHYINSQTRINEDVHTFNNFYPKVTLSPLSSSVNYLIYSCGPFRINLDKNGNPQPMFIAFVPEINVGTSTTVTGTFKAHLRPVDSDGVNSSLEFGTFTTSSNTSGVAGSSLKWYTFQTPSASYISSSMNTNSSVFQTKMKYPQQLMTRTTKSLTINDSFQNVCMSYLDIYFMASSITGSNTSTIRIRGIYGREVNVVGDINTP